MKRVYWRPPGVSRRALITIALVALAAFAVVERFPVQTKQPFHEQKLSAARLAQTAFGVIKAEKLARGITLDREGDPYETGLIGRSLTPVTSNTGYLGAKRVSINPNFAAVILQMLVRAGVAQGDLVAVGTTGSFPALNIATYAALHVIGAEPIAIASVSASEWGANDVNLTWVDMERVLEQKHVFRFRSVAASRGGIDDRGFGMSKEGRGLLDAAIARNELEPIDPSSIADSIERRMKIYRERAGGRPIKAYVNVGGGAASVGTQVGKKQFRSGVNRDPPPGPGLMDSVMLRFVQSGVPVVHVSGIKALARRNGLSLNEDGKLAPVGEGSIYEKAEYNRWLALGGVLVILAVMLAFIRLDIGMRILGSVPGRKPDAEPQRMI